MYVRRTNSKLASYERQRFGGMGARHSRRPLGGFGETNASDDDKTALTSQINNIESNFDTARKESSYADLVQMKDLIAKHNSWSSSWSPVWAGGYYSSSDISARIEGLISRIPAEVAKAPGVQEAIKRGYIPIAKKEDKKEDKKEEEEEESIWPGISDIFSSILPVVGGAVKADLDRKHQEDLLKLALIGNNPPQPPTVIVQGGGGSKTGLYAGLGLVGLAVVVGGIFMLRGRG